MASVVISEQELAYAYRGARIQARKVVATRPLPPGYDREDLEQVAALAVYEATLNFDPERQAQFKTHAWNMVRWRIGHVFQKEHLPTETRLIALNGVKRSAWDREDPSGNVEAAVFARLGMGCQSGKVETILALLNQRDPRFVLYLRLRFWDELHDGQIAELLGLSRGGANALGARALKQARELWLGSRR